jgi:hypothetical protein
MVVLQRFLVNDRPPGFCDPAFCIVVAAGARGNDDITVAKSRKPEQHQALERIGSGEKEHVKSMGQR